MNSVGGVGSYEASISLRELVLRRLEAEPSPRPQARELPSAAEPPAEPPPPGCCGPRVDVYA
jgi:hypothetical protein